MLKMEKKTNKNICGKCHICNMALNGMYCVRGAHTPISTTAVHACMYVLCICCIPFAEFLKRHFNVLYVAMPVK